MLYPDAVLNSLSGPGEGGSEARMTKLTVANQILYLEIAEIDVGGQFLVEKNDSGHKNSFFKVKPVFRG